jgi:microsomal dipeptidase-like Zn-dependent dipeptidase
MTCFARILFAVLLIVWPIHAVKTATEDYNLDFEQGLDHWTKCRTCGSAFDAQPIDGASVRTDRTKPVKVGGNYWRDLPYSVGQHGRYLILTDDPAKGELRSDSFTLSRDTPNFSFLIGGSEDIAAERFELQILFTSPAEAEDLEHRIIVWTQTVLHKPIEGPLIRDDNYLVAIAVAGKKDPNGSAVDLLDQKSFLLPDFLFGRMARLRIVDNSTSAHIGVDNIRFTDAAPGPYRPNLWGLADYHTHLTNYIAFGALNGVRTAWGVPGGRYADYAYRPQGRRLEALDIPDCIKSHGGGPSAELFLASVEGRVHRDQGMFQTLLQFVRTQFSPHPHKGGPSFRDFPTFLSGAHEQMHITQIHRAWEGGLRLMTVLAVQNVGAEYLTARVGGDGEIHPNTERAILEAQICAVRQLTRMNDDWMQIAYTPDEARDIISHGKLAIVLGIEMDGIGRIDGMNSFAEEVQYLWDLGIRQVFPIHGPNGRLGGAAAWEPAYNTLNDLLYRGKLNLHASDLPRWPPRFFDVKDSGCRFEDGGKPPGECVLFRFAPKQNRGYLLGKIPLVTEVDVYGMSGDKDNLPGYMNVLGLTDDGRDYIRELMKKGIIVDLSHMSEQSVNDTYALMGLMLAEQGHRECGFYGPGAPESCDKWAYPLFVSHAHFRALSFQAPAQTKVTPLLPSEYEVSDKQLLMLHRTGGAVGPFVAEEPTDPSRAKKEGYDCAMSSKGFLRSFRYALDSMHDTGVGLASDFTFIPSVAPRFGPNACWGASKKGFDSEKNETWAADQYRRDKQYPETMVKYLDENPTAPDAITRYEMGEHPYNFNEEGLANYGLLPDLLQDLKNVSMNPREFEALFTSAQGFVQMWEKAVNLSGGNASFKPRPLDCELACRNLCPESPNRGAPSPRR